MKFRLQCVVALSCAWFVSVSTAGAQSDTSAEAIVDAPLEGATTLDTELLLNGSVITATGREQSRALAPANIVTWERDEIYRHGWTTLAQVLANTPGLYVIDDLVLPSLGVRGVGPGLHGGTRLVRIMINGVQVNFRSDLTAFLGSEYIPFSIVERIEIAKGPLSALYGANAFLATVNIITKKPVDGLDGELYGDVQVMNGNGGGGFGGAAGYGNRQISALAAYDQQHLDRSGLRLHQTFPSQDASSPTYQNFFDRRSEDDTAKPRSLFGLVEARSDTFGILQVQGGRQELNSAAEFQPNSVLTHKSRNSLYNNWASASYIYGYGKDVTVSATGGLSSGKPRDADQYFVTADDRFRYERNYGYDAYDLGAALEARLPAQLELKVGLDYASQNNDALYYTQIYTQPIGLVPAGRTVERGVARTHKLTNLGLYAQIGGNPISALPDLYVLGNIRFDDPNLFKQQLSWRTGVAYQFSSRVTSKLFFGRAFQTPSAVQLFAQPGFGNAYNLIGSRAQAGLPDLEPQSVISGEFTTKVALSDTIAIDGSVYYQQVRNKIEFTQIASNFTTRNLADQDFAGGELGLRASSSRLSGYAYGSVQATKNTNTQDEDPGFGFHAPSEFPTATLYGGATVRIPEAYLAVDVTGRLVGPRGASQSNYLLNDRRNYNLQTYATFDLNLTSLDVLLFGAGFETKLMIAMHNIFDVRYSDPGHGGFDLPVVGRNFMFRLAQAF